MQLPHTVTSARCTQLVRVGACDASLTGMCELAYIRITIDQRPLRLYARPTVCMVARPPMERAVWKLS